MNIEDIKIAKIKADLQKHFPEIIIQKAYNVVTLNVHKCQKEVQAYIEEKYPQFEYCGGNTKRYVALLGDFRQ